MNKPKLQDFNLTERDFEILDQQKNNYENSKNQHIEKTLKNIRYSLIVLPIVALLVAIITIVVDDANVDAFWPILFIGGIIESFVFLFYYIEKSFFDDRYHNEKIYKSCVNSSLENRITQYKNALQDYNREQERLSCQFWTELSGYAFEREIAQLYKKLGYDVYITPKSGDGGVDIILKNDYEKIAVQCKHHSKPVGPAPVRELIGVVAIRDFDRGIFVSLNGFTRSVQQEVYDSNIKIELLDIYDILRLSNSV